MTRTQNTRRGGFTLVELLVGISIFLALAGLTLLLYPGARDQDRVRYAVSDISANLRMAQSMAARDKTPRGVRFIVTANAEKPDAHWVTELQYVEQPPPLIPNRNPLTSANPETEPRIRFKYNYASGTSVTPATPAGSIMTRQCIIENLTAEQAAVVKVGCTIVMPVFSAWHKISGIGAQTAATGALVNQEVTLEVYPDAIMGGSTDYLTYHFSIYLLPTPLVGEPTILLPKNICVDLNVGVPSQVNASTDFDIVFGPDGKLVSAPTGQIFLWVRDYTKPAPYSIVMTGTVRSAPWLAEPQLSDSLRKGGEQHIIAVRSSGAHGSNQVAWPDSSGTFAPYALAQQEIR